MLTERLTPLTSPIIIAFGYKARHGKDTVAKYLADMYGHSYDIRRYSFASALRKEVNDAVLAKLDFPCHKGSKRSGFNHSIQSATAELCLEKGVQYDPNYTVDEQYPLGKQRALLEYWGQHRRDQDPFYWIHKLEATLIAEKPCIALITDLRHTNEANWVQYLQGTTVKVWREGVLSNAGNHVSETQLDTFDFDHTILNTTLDELYLKAIEVFESILDQQQDFTYVDG